MDILYLLIPLALLAAAGICAALWWAIDAEQFDDLAGPDLAIVMDDDRADSGKPGKDSHAIP
jgi:cbb3-type cytochrome oxidase maturation protein